MQVLPCTASIYWYILECSAVRHRHAAVLLPENTPRLSCRHGDFYKTLF